MIDLNLAQKEAVEYDQGPLLVVAGPGSGKTRVIIERILHLVKIRELAVKMRDRPAVKSIKYLPEIEDMRFLTHPKVIDKVRSTTGKFDKIGLSYLDDFCFMVNNIFSYIDSMQYATYDDSIEANEKTDIIIKNLRTKTINEFTEILEYLFKPYSKNVAKAVLEMIRLKIPMIFMLTQYQRMAKVMI